jgi:polyhydroxybutyrate depolymerase
MKTRKIVITAVAVVVALPVVLLLLVGGLYYVWFYESPRANGAIVSSNQEREYLLYVPKSYDPEKSTPLVISMHAALLWPAAQMQTSQWNKVADKYGFIVVYPSGTTPGGKGTGVLPKIWLLRPETVLAANVRFISDLIDTLSRAYNIDPQRIYVNGFSNGGAMAFALSCRLSQRIAAVGTVSAAQDQQPWSWCGDSRPLPLMNFHGTADLVPYNGGRVWAVPKPFPSVPTWTANWAVRNHCQPNPVESLVASDVTRIEYMDCADKATVVLYAVHGGGHQWPGGKPLPEWILGPSTSSIDATNLMWAFFSQHWLATK